MSTIDCLHAQIEIDVDVMGTLARTHRQKGESDRVQEKDSTLYLIFVHLLVLLLLIHWVEIGKLIIADIISCEFSFSFLLSFYKNYKLNIIIHMCLGANRNSL